MRRFVQAFSRYRPRLLTVLLLALIAAVITLANLSAERSLPQRDWRAFGHKSYGWPLIWHRFVVWHRSTTEGWYMSYPRLAVNLALWLTILVVPAATCEWLVRRSRPRLQWSLRTMLAAAPLIAMACAWFVHARDRAIEEDALIAMIHGRDDFQRGDVWMERWGPRWLDLVGADRLRRRIVTVSIYDLWDPDDFSDSDDREILRRVARLRGLRHLDLAFGDWTPKLGLAETLNSLPRLRTLSIYGAPSQAWQSAVGKMSDLEQLTVTYDADLCATLERLPHLKSLTVSNGDVEDSQRLLTTIGKLKHLEELWLTWMITSGSSLACLNGLADLRFLGLSQVYENRSAILNFQRKSDGGLLLNLPPLARLEAIDLEESEIYDGDVAPLANLPRLRWLNLAHTRISDVGLAHLAPAPSLEELAVSGRLICPSGLDALSAIERLRSLHLDGYGVYQLGSEIKWSTLPLDNGSAIAVWPQDSEAFHQALEALRRSRPGIVVDNHVSPLRSRFAPDIEDLGPDSQPERQWTWWPASEWPALSPRERAYFQKQGGWARFDAAGWEPSGPTTTF